jgi:hypothetical protein
MSTDKFRKVAAPFFLSAGFLIGAFRYLDKGIYHSSSQWDLRSSVSALATRLTGNPDPTGEGFAPSFLPPYLPIAYPLLDGLGHFPWPAVKVAWLMFMCLGLMAATVLTLREILREHENLPQQHRRLLVLSIVLFKGTYLALATGQLSLLIIFLLLGFVYVKESEPWLAFFCLAIATMKIHLALPFYMYLLLKSDFRFFARSAAAALALNLVVSVFYLGPMEHARQFIWSLNHFAPEGTNDMTLAGGSGRIDLAPLAVIFGLSGQGLIFAQVVVLGGGLAFLFLSRRCMSDRMLLFNCNLICCMAYYHRDYDLVLLLLLGLPFIYSRRNEFSCLNFLLLLPIVLPIQRMNEWGTQALPSMGFIFNFLGSAMVVSLGVVGWVLNKREGVFYKRRARLQAAR